MTDDDLLRGRPSQVTPSMSYISASSEGAVDKITTAVERLTRDINTVARRQNTDTTRVDNTVELLHETREQLHQVSRRAQQLTIAGWVIGIGVVTEAFALLGLALR